MLREMRTTDDDHRGYVAPVMQRNWRGRREILVSDLSHREALAELGKLLNKVGRGRTILIRVSEDA